MLDPSLGPVYQTWVGSQPVHVPTTTCQCIKIRIVCNRNQNLNSVETEQKVPKQTTDATPGETPCTTFLDTPEYEKKMFEKEHTNSKRPGNPRMNYPRDQMREKRAWWTYNQWIY